MPLSTSSPTHLTLGDVGLVFRKLDVKNGIRQLFLVLNQKL